MRVRAKWKPPTVDECTETSMTAQPLSGHAGKALETLSCDEGDPFEWITFIGDACHYPHYLFIFPPARAS